MTTDEPIVRVREVSKRFGKVHALQKVDLDIFPGHIVGLLGANGAGKSTLLRHIIGLYLPDEGSCVTYGREARDLGAEELARIGYVHQEGELLNWMTAGQLIRYVAAYYPNWNAKLEQEYVADFEVDRKAKVGSLSPGQRQRLSILLGIGFEPELLILDEPASALDPVARVQFLDMLLTMIQRQDRTIVISSHILSDVEKVIDHAVIMKAGRIVRDCGLDELREEYCRIRVTALESELPEQLPFSGVLDCRRDSRSAVLTLQGCSAEQLRTQADTMGCEIDIRPLNLEEIYEQVVRDR